MRCDGRHQDDRTGRLQYPEAVAAGYVIRSSGCGVCEHKNKTRGPPKLPSARTWKWKRGIPCISLPLSVTLGTLDRGWCIL